MTDISKMRSEFEAWVLNEYPNQSLERFNPLHGVTEGEYTGFTVQHCWKAWKASRQDLVIELPRPFQTNIGAMLTPNGVRHAIQSVGLRCEVKS